MFIQIIKFGVVFIHISLNAQLLKGCELHKLA